MIQIVTEKPFSSWLSKVMRALVCGKSQLQSAEEILQANVFFVEALEAGKGIAQLFKASGADAVAIIPHLDGEKLVPDGDVDKDVQGICLAVVAVGDGVLDHGLEDQLGNPVALGLRVHVPVHLDLSRVAVRHQCRVVGGGLDLLLDGHVLVRRPQAVLQENGQVLDHLVGRGGQLGVF